MAQVGLWSRLSSLHRPRLADHPRGPDHGPVQGQSNRLPLILRTAHKAYPTKRREVGLHHSPVNSHISITSTSKRKRRLNSIFVSEARLATAFTTSSISLSLASSLSASPQCPLRKRTTSLPHYPLHPPPTAAVATTRRRLIVSTNFPPHQEDHYQHQDQDRRRMGAVRLLLTSQAHSC